MATTPLKSYLHDIEGLIGAGQNDEAIAHCLHILQTFPKSIAVYRMLGKAYLENQRFSDATDVFHRILSSVPDDFVSHIGMSIIREDEGNLDESIWHMERAFETQPYNPGVQEELRRLYGRRDGMEPPKLRLTRGALARLYAKGDLYQQAIGELRSALAEDPHRPDLQVVLARAYYMAGQRIEAVETCSTLLKKYPYCLDANALLSVILPETERAQDAQNYLQRTLAMDPYLGDIPVKSLPNVRIPESSVLVEVLNYTDAKTVLEESQPAWATSLGVDLKQPEKDETLPDWLTSSEIKLGLERESATAEEPQMPESNLPELFPWETDSDESPTTSAEIPPGDEIPDWLKDAGWGPSTGEAKKEQQPLTFTDETGLPAEGELAPADIPEWLRESAPPGILEQDQGQAELEPTEESLPWLQETPPGTTESQYKTESDIPEWLLKPSQTPEAVSSEEVSDWLSDETSKTEKSVIDKLSPEDFPLSETPEESPPLEVRTAEEIAPVNEFPEIFKETEAEIPEDAVEPPQIDGVTEWLESVTTGDLATDSVGITEWLSNLDTETKTVPEKVPPSPTEIFPWLREEETEEQPEKETPEKPSAEISESLLPPQDTSPAAAEEEIPAWMKDVDSVILGEVEAVPDEAKPAFVEELPADLDLNDQDAALAWLESLAEKQGVPQDELFTRPEGQITAPTPDQQTPSEITATPAEELPEWLKETATEAQIEIGDSEKFDLAETAEPILPIHESIDSETSYGEGSLPEGVDLTDQDAALAWLEGLSAKQSAPAENLFAEMDELGETAPIGEPEKPSEIVPQTGEETPDSLKTVAGEVQEIASIIEPEVATTEADELPAATSEEIPDWLIEAAEIAEVPNEVAPEMMAETEVPSQVTPEELSSWLTETGGEEKVEGFEPEAIIHETWEIPLTPVEEPTTQSEVNEDETPTAGVKEDQGFTPTEESLSPAVPSPSTEWIKETEIPEWLEKVEKTTPTIESEKESEMPAWLVDATQADKDVSWVPPTIEEETPGKGGEHAQVDINTAALGDLERLPGIGYVLAQNIKNYRDAHGPFTRIEDLLSVPGVVPGNIDYLKEWVTIPPVEKAITAEESVLKSDPDKFILQQARDAIQKGNISEAIGQYSLLLGKMTLLNDIILDLQDALYRYPVDISIWQTLGDAYMRNNQLQDALEAYTKAEELLR